MECGESGVEWQLHPWRRRESCIYLLMDLCLTAVENVLEVWPVHDFQQRYVVVFLSVESDDEQDVFVKVFENG